MAATIDQYKIKIDVEGQKAVEHLTDSLDKLHTTITRTAQAGIAAFAALGASAVKLAGDLVDSADALGLNAAKLYQLNAALEQSGGKFGDAASLFRGFSQSLGDVEKGSSETIDALKQLGLSKQQIENLSDEQLFQAVVDGLGKMEAGFERNRIGMVLLGKAADGIDFTKLAEGSKKAIDPALEARLKAADDALDNLVENFRTVQLVALEAIQPLLDAMGKIQISAEDARKGIQILGAILAGAFTAVIIGNIIKAVQAMRALAVAIKAAAVAQTLLTGLIPVVGAATVIAAIGAATTAYIALGKAMEDAGDAKEKLEGAAPEAPKTDTKDDGKPKRSVGQTPEELAVKAAREQNELLKKQNESANEYQRIINGTIGMMDGLAARTKLIAEIDRDAANQKAAVQKQIDVELSKGKKSNEGLVVELKRQLTIIDEQAAARKKLGLEELQSNETLRMNTAEMQKQLGLIDLQTEKNNANKEAELRRKVINGEMTEQQMSDELALSKIESTRYNKVEKLQKQFENEKNEARRKELQDEIALTNAKAQLEKTTLEQSVKDRKDKEGSYIAGTIKAMEELSKQFDPYKMGQDAIMMGWKRISDAVDTFVETGKFKFSDFARSIIADYAKMIAKAQIFNALNQIVGAIFPGLALPGKAEGGPVKAGQPYVVGEKGPELFMPKQAGDIIPNKDIGKSKMAISSDRGPTNAPITNNYNTYNINALDAKSVAQLFAENRKAIFGANKMAEREMSYVGAR